jgi:glycerol-3-phosphate dehydrogenase [NAD(P)+]
MIGKGYSVRSAQLEMKMIAEGYYATAGLHAINQEHGIVMPIAETMYRILYENKSVQREMRELLTRLQ